MSEQVGVVVSVNTGRPRELTWQGRRLRTAIWKSPVDGRVAVTAEGVEGDQQANLSVHGGAYKAVYAYASEDLAWWAAELGADLAPGTFGDNLTTSGIEVSGALVGERWAVGDVEVEVTSPRTPCVKLGARMGDPRFPRRFAAAGRPGAYLRVRTGGDIGQGDPVRVLWRPARSAAPSVAEVSRIYHGERHRAAELLDVPGLDPVWVEWARERLARA